MIMQLFSENSSNGVCYFVP